MTGRGVPAGGPSSAIVYPWARSRGFPSEVRTAGEHDAHSVAAGQWVLAGRELQLSTHQRRAGSLRTAAVRVVSTAEVPDGCG
jgi:hypothetical protein